MSDNYEETADWLTDTESTITETIDVPDGPELPIEVKEITEDELEAIEEKAAEGPDSDAEATKRAIDEYLVSPAVDVDNVPLGKRNQLFVAMMLAWSGISAATATVDELDLPNQGNR